MAGPVIDAHLHVWDPARARYDWLGPEFGPINRALNVEDVAADLTTAGITHAVLVQSADNLDDTDLMIESAARHPEIVGIVGFAPLEYPEQVARLMSRWRDDPLMVGVRTLIHENPDPDYLLRPAVSESLELVAGAGLSFDVVAVLPRHLEIVPILAERHPALRLVIDHLAKPPVGIADEVDWHNAISRAAAAPSVFGKVSGLYASAGSPAQWTIDAIRPAFDRALEVFGPERLMYGGDWPICVLAGGYRRVWTGAQSLLATLGPDERDRILAGTAMDVYRLDPRGFEVARS